MTMQIGRLCVKIAGRDASKKCVIIDILDNNFVLIDGETRRRKCNILHLEPLNQVIEISKGASHDEVVKAFEHLGLKALTTKPKEKKDKPKQKRKTPQQLREQKEEKRKLRDLFKFKKKEEKKEETSLEAKAGLSEEKQVEPAPQHELAIKPVEEHSLATAQEREFVEKNEAKTEGKEKSKTLAKSKKITKKIEE